MTSREAEDKFIDLAQCQETYGLDIYFGKNTDGQVQQIAIGPKGVTVFRKKYRDHQVVNKFLWSKIKNVQFAKKNFTVAEKDRGKIKTTSYEMENKLQAKVSYPV